MEQVQPTQQIMDQILDTLRDALEGQIVSPVQAHLGSLLTRAQDFRGQHQVEVISTILLCFVGVCMLLRDGSRA